MNSQNLFPAAKENFHHLHPYIFQMTPFHHGGFDYENLKQYNKMSYVFIDNLLLYHHPHLMEYPQCAPPSPQSHHPDET